MYFSTDIQQTFEEKHPNSEYPINISDLILSANGIVASIIIMIQHIRYRVRKI